MYDVIRTKTDIQQCIANGIKEFSTSYGMLLFEGNYKEYLNSFSFYKNLEIKPSNDKLIFNIELCKYKIKMISKENMKKIKDISNNIQCFDMLEQIWEINKTDEQREAEKDNSITMINNLLENIQLNEKEYRDPTKNDFEKMERAKQTLDCIFNTNTEIDVSEYYLSIGINFENIKLNKIDLEKIVNIAQDLDIFVICPVYETEDLDDNIMIGVRLFFAINLEKEEE